MNVLNVWYTAREIGQRLRRRRASVLARWASADAVRRLKAHAELWQILDEYCQRSNSTGCSFTDYWQLYSLVRRMRPAEILECGTGVSTVVMAVALRDNERRYGEPGRITSMEDGIHWFEHAKDILPKELEPYVDLVLIMTVNPGFGGQEFIDLTNKIERARHMIDDLQPQAELEVDGGVNNKIVPRLIKAGVDVIVSGSALFSSSNIAEAIQDMKKIMNLSC